ncbi:MAG: BamA/TamA family outer membrane protein [Candidatus Aminicenantales bacterium]
MFFNIKLAENFKRIFIVLTLFLGILGLMVETGFGQYFGRNKVQYEKFDYKILKTEHFDIYFYPEEKEAIMQAARLAERWYYRLSRIFSQNLRSRQPLIMYASHPHFEQTTVIPELVGEGTGGFTEQYKRRIVLPFSGSLDETDHVIGHELVHAFQYDLIFGAKGRMGGGGAVMQIPLWFIEGLAEYLSIGPVDANTAMWMRDMVKKKKMPAIKKLNNPRYFPYRYGHAVWAYIGGRWGDLMVTRIMREAFRMGDYKKAMEANLKLTLDQLSKDWHETLEKDYGPLIQTNQDPDSLSRLLVKGSEEVYINVSPSISPDGKRLVFLSSKDLFSIEMFMSDAQTGKITQKVTKTAVNPHIQSLQFINSSGSWDSEGQRFVFGAISKGKPILAFIDSKGNKVDKEIEFPELGEILNPTWSPDGRSIAFSGLIGGFTDIFIYDLETAKLRQMTQDPYGDIHPAWSPDGRSIAFVTERFTTHLPILNIGNYSLALLDPVSGEVQQIQGFKGAKNINPQWSADSKSIYFLSDRNGITDIYRFDRESEKTYQITNFYTGASGITALSPALSVAAKSNRLVYSLYNEGSYSIYAVESMEFLVGKPVEDMQSQYGAAVLPPKDRPGSEILGLLKNPLFGLPETSSFQVTPYNPKLSVDYVSPPQLGVGIDRFGTYAGGGIAISFSDMMGYHNLMTMAQVYNRLIDSAVLLGYQNSQHRWNFGGVVQRIPYVYGDYAIYDEYIGNLLTTVEEEHLFRQINYEITGFAIYPFNQIQRFEIAAGYQLIDFDQEIVTRIYAWNSSQLLYEDIQKLEAPSSLHFAYVSAAFVYDSAQFGATSPLIGQSYRLEVTPITGSLSYFNVLTDFRRYFMPIKPFSLAFRFIHYGRYGKDADDERIWPIFLGYGDLIRGYNYSSFSAGEATDIFDRLFGSKVLAANAELRFPLFGALKLGRGFYGIFPVDFIAFYDVGLVWDNANKAWFLGGERKPLASAGIGLRVNLFGYAVVGVNLVKPLSRPQKDWYFQFSFWPGY